MLWNLTEDVWFGDGHAPFEAIDNGLPVGAIINVAHHLRSRYNYWQRLGKIRHDILFLRLAKKDREDIDDVYANAMASFVDSCVLMCKLPIVTHCQMGGHRGPTSAIFVAWHLAGRTHRSLDRLEKRAIAFRPRLVRGRNYYRSTMAWCREHSA